MRHNSVTIIICPEKSFQKAVRKSLNLPKAKIISICGPIIRCHCLISGLLSRVISPSGYLKHSDQPLAETIFNLHDLHKDDKTTEADIADRGQTVTKTTNPYLVNISTD